MNLKWKPVTRPHKFLQNQHGIRSLHSFWYDGHPPIDPIIQQPSSSGIRTTRQVVVTQELNLRPVNFKFTALPNWANHMWSGNRTQIRKDLPVMRFEAHLHKYCLMLIPCPEHPEINIDNDDISRNAAGRRYAFLYYWCLVKWNFFMNWIEELFDTLHIT